LWPFGRTKVSVGRRRRRLVIGVILGLATALAGVGFRGVLFDGNFGVVEASRVYRAAQPSSNLPRLIQELRLASILNLRGGSDADAWYASEVRETRERGVAFYDLPMSATRRPLRRELLTLLDLFERCPYPLLIHCKSGSDRTGLVSGLYLLYVRGESPEQALRAFSLFHGHVALGGTERLHEPFNEYETWLNARHLTHTPGRFREWVEHEYRADDPVAKVEPLPQGPRKRR